MESKLLEWYVYIFNKVGTDPEPEFLFKTITLDEAFQKAVEQTKNDIKESKGLIEDEDPMPFEEYKQDVDQKDFNMGKNAVYKLPKDINKSPRVYLTSSCDMGSDSYLFAVREDRLDDYI